MVDEPTVYIVDDSPDVRNSLSWLVQSVRLRAHACDSGEQFLAGCHPDQPGCLVLDLRMPGMGGMQLLESLATRGIQLPVIVFTGHGEVETAVRAMKAGALDFVEKPFTQQGLLEKIQKALQEDKRRRQAREEKVRIARRIAQLTPRESEVLELISSGLTNRAIAKRLGISEKTVEVHRAKIMEKMHAGSLAELIHMVNRNQLWTTGIP